MWWLSAMEKKYKEKERASGAKGGNFKWDNLGVKPERDEEMNQKNRKERSGQHEQEVQKS